VHKRVCISFIVNFVIKVPCIIMLMYVCCRAGVDLEGMDLSWNNSQWISLHGDVSPAHSSDDCEPLPQLDGLTDNKSKYNK